MRRHCGVCGRHRITHDKWEKHKFDGGERWVLSKFSRYAVGGVAFYLANILFMFVMVDGLMIHYLVATTVSTVVLFVSRYFVFEKFVFNEGKSS